MRDRVADYIGVTAAIRKEKKTLLTSMTLVYNAARRIPYTATVQSYYYYKI